MRIIKKIGQYILAQAEWFILAVGILLRLRHLLENRSLWLDEACTAGSITSRSYSEILQNHEIMPEFARSPTLFMLVEKLCVGVWGNTEIVLRLFPFFSGVLALTAFVLVARMILTRRALLIAAGLFALAEPLVYYSAELKQYSTDLCCAILLIEFSRRVIQKGFKIDQCLWLGLTGAVALWLSNAMIFVLAGTGVVILLNKPWSKGSGVIAALTGTAVLWLASFTGLYFLSLQYMVGHASITDTWKGAFCTTPLFSLATLGWAWNVFTLSFQNPAGLKWYGLMLPLLIFGAWVLGRKDKNGLLLWLMPLVFTFLAALFGKYPFYGRVLLFLTAGYYLFIAAAMDDLLSRIKIWSVPLACILIAVVFFQPGVDAAMNALHSRSKTDNRGVMEFLSEYYHPGDFIYLSTLAQPPFWYYAAKTGLTAKFLQPVVGVSDGELLRGFKIAKFALDPKEIDGRQFMLFRNEYNIFNAEGMFRANMSSQKDKQNVSFVPLDSAYHYPATGRTWLVLSGPGPLEAGVNALILETFNKAAKQLLSFESLNAGVYLYDMR